MEHFSLRDPMLVGTGPVKYTSTSSILKPGTISSLRSRIKFTKHPQANSKYVEYELEDNCKLIKDSVPYGTKYLIFNNYYRYPLDKDIIPASVTRLAFKSGVSDLRAGILPDSIKILDFGTFSQELIPGIIPGSVTGLKIGDKFNHTLVPYGLPDKLVKLRLGDDYNTKLLVGSLPDSLCYLFFGRSFDRKIDSHVLPDSLQHLIFGFAYNQVLEPGVLPNKLQSLIFGARYNQIISPHVIPTSVTEIQFGYSYNQTIQLSSIPTGVIKLFLNCGMTDIILHSNRDCIVSDYNKNVLEVLVDRIQQDTDRHPSHIFYKEGKYHIVVMSIKKN